MGLLYKFQQIRVFIFDIDGVLTNGDLLILETGEMARVMNIKDGYALQLAIKKGYKIYVVSGATSSAVKQRLNKLGVLSVFFDVKNKKQFIIDLMQTEAITREQTLFMGDDIPDLPVFDIVSLSCCPADAVIDVRNTAIFISTKKGGKGCVREVIEKVLRSNNHWSFDENVTSI